MIMLTIGVTWVTIRFVVFWLDWWQLSLWQVKKQTDGHHPVVVKNTVRTLVIWVAMEPITCYFTCATECDSARACLSSASNTDHATADATTARDDYERKKKSRWRNSERGASYIYSNSLPPTLPPTLPSSLPSNLPPTLPPNLSPNLPSLQRPVCVAIVARFKQPWCLSDWLSKKVGQQPRTKAR